MCIRDRSSTFFAHLCNGIRADISLCLTLPVQALSLIHILLTQVAPPGVTAHVVDVAKMIRVYNNPKYAGERVMLLFTNPTDVERLVEGGVKITSVNRCV